MRTQIPVPSKGDAMRASWGASVANRVNELCAMAPANMLARDGFGGMGAQPLPANLRDRRSAASGRPMPFDLKAEIETNEAGTQKRLVVKYYYITATVQFDAWDILGPDLDYSLAENGWYPVYTGEWQSVDDPFDEEVSILLWYDIHLMIEGGASGGSITSDPFAGTDDKWWVEEAGASDAEPIAEWGPPIVGEVGIAYHVCASIKLGEVRASGNQVDVRQWFHGTLCLYDFIGLNTPGGGGGAAAGGDKASAKCGCWKVDEGTLVDCYYNVGGITKKAANQNIPPAATGYLCAAFSSGGVSLQVYATIALLNQAQADESKYIVPLYLMSGGEVSLDMRNAPQIQVFEGSL